MSTSKQTIMTAFRREASPARIPVSIANAASRKQVPVAIVQKTPPKGSQAGTHDAHAERKMKCVRPNEIGQIPYRRLRTAVLRCQGEPGGERKANTAAPDMTIESSSNVFPQGSHTRGVPKIAHTQIRANTE